MTARLQRPVVGAMTLVAALLLFASQDVLVKEVSARVPVVEILTLRIFVVVLIVSILYRRSGRQTLSPREKLTLALRGLLAFCAFTAFYMALARIPMATVSAVYMSAPLFVTALSVPLLGETVGPRRWIAILFGFCGVLIIVKPEAGLLQSAALLPLVSAFFYSFIPIITRCTAIKTRVITMTLYNSVTYMVCCIILSALIFAFPAGEQSPLLWQALAEPWVKPAAADSIKILVSGVIFTTAVYSITVAYRQAPVSVVAPFEYSYLLWSVVLGYLVFSEEPGPRVIAGAAIVLLCGLYILYRERALQRQLPTVRSSVVD